MAIEYITSKNLFSLICDTLKLMDKSLVKHGKRVSYIMSKMLECKGGYEKYEIADFMLLAVLHDIGAYKTDDVRKQLTFEAKNPLPHSIYGYLFLKYLSPLEEQSKMILYHHADTSQIAHVDYTYMDEAEILKVAEIMDIWMKAFGEKFDPHMIDRYRGTKYQDEACDLLFEAVEKYDIFTKLKDGSYEKEYEESLEYILLSDEEKEKYLKMLMYCTGLRDETMVSSTIATIYVSREIGKKLRISELDKNEIYYAALLHDLGMLAMPKELIDAPRKLEEAELNLIHTHVELTSEALKGKLAQSIIDISATHHERFDGSGYPRGIKGSVMNNKQAILQIAELVVNLSSDKPYRKAHSKEEIVKELNDGIVSGKFDGIVTDTFLKYYDEIMEKAMEKASAALVLYQKLKRNSDQVYKNFTK
ncbi:MAG: HD domain-containing protein [Lachnospiraceae bacterium]|nr:HD domain-containing protein [Lachnospiraceae bacterium]